MLKSSSARRMRGRPARSRSRGPGYGSSPPATRRRAPGPVPPPGRPAGPIGRRPIGEHQAQSRSPGSPRRRAHHGRSRVSPRIKTAIFAMQSLQYRDYGAAVNSLTVNPPAAAKWTPILVGNDPEIVFCNPFFSPFRAPTAGNRRRGLQSDTSGPAGRVSPGRRPGLAKAAGDTTKRPLQLRLSRSLLRDPAATRSGRGGDKVAEGAGEGQPGQYHESQGIRAELGIHHPNDH